MSLPHILLGMLEEPASGYDLKKRFEEGARHFWSAELAQIYPTLQRLEERGLVTSRTVASGRGPDRRVYRRLARGRRELLAWLQGEPRVATERFAYLAQLFFLGALGDLGETERFLRELKRKLAARLEALRAIEAAWAAGTPGFPDALDDAGFHAHMTLRMGLRSLAEKVAWCDECLARTRARVGATA